MDHLSHRVNSLVNSYKCKNLVKITQVANQISFCSLLLIHNKRLEEPKTSLK